MTIDEAIAYEKEVAKDICVEAMLCHANPDNGKLDDCIERGNYHEQIAEWLEDYKRIKMLIPIEQALKAEYNKAIDDFAKWLENKKYLMKEIQNHDFCYTHYDELKANYVTTEYFAEQLKEGVKE